MDKGERECVLGMRGNGPEQGERILEMILTRGKTHREGIQKGENSVPQDEWGG